MKNSTRKIKTAERTQSGGKSEKKVYEWEKQLREANIRVLTELLGSDFPIRNSPLRK